MLTNCWDWKSFGLEIFILNPISSLPHMKMFQGEKADPGWLLWAPSAQSGRGGIFFMKKIEKKEKEKEKRTG